MNNEYSLELEIEEVLVEKDARIEYERGVTSTGCCSGRPTVI